MDKTTKIHSNTKAVLLLLDKWAKKQNPDKNWKIISNLATTKANGFTDYAMENLAEFIRFETLKEMPKLKAVIYKGCAWKGHEYCCSAVVKARQHITQEIFDNIDVEGIYDDFERKADRFVITTERYTKLKKKYKVR